MTTGEAVKSKRIERDLLQSELAEMVGVSKTHIYCIEKGRRKASFETMVKIAHALRCSVDDLAGTEGKSA